MPERELRRHQEERDSVKQLPVWQKTTASRQAQSMPRTPMADAAAAEGAAWLPEGVEEAVEFTRSAHGPILCGSLKRSFAAKKREVYEVQAKVEIKHLEAARVVAERQRRKLVLLERLRLLDERLLAQKPHLSAEAMAILTAGAMPTVPAAGPTRASAASDSTVAPGSTPARGFARGSPRLPNVPKPSGTTALPRLSCRACACSRCGARGAGVAVQQNVGTKPGRDRR